MKFSKLSIFSIFTPWIGYVIFRYLNVAEFYPVEISTVLFVGAHLLITFFGFLCANIIFSLYRRSRPPGQIVPYQEYDRVFPIVLAAALLAVIISFDFFYILGGGLSSIVELREARHGVGPRLSVIGAIQAAGSGVFVISSVRLLDRYVKKGFDWLLCLLVAVNVLAVSTLLLSGGRNSIFQLFFMCAIYVYLLRSQWLIHPRFLKHINKLILWFGLVFVLLILYSAYIFNRREAVSAVLLDNQPPIVLDVLSKWGVFIQDYNDIIIGDGSVFIPILLFDIYIFHGLNALDTILQSDLGSPLFNGSLIFYNFFILFKDVSLSGQDFNLGFHYTLPGVLFLDFGAVGSLVFSFLFGVFVFISQHLFLHRGFYSLKIFYPFLIMVLWLSPIYCAINQGIGPSMVFLIGVFSIQHLFRILWRLR